MYHKNHLLYVVLMLAILLASCSHAGAANQPANPTLTFGDNTCSYSGPKSVSVNGFTLDIVLAGQKPLPVGYALVTLHTGKTIADLQAWPSYKQPDWLTDLTAEVYLATTRSFPYNPSKSFLYHPNEPVFLVCFQWNAMAEVNKIGAFGPIAVH